MTAHMPMLVSSFLTGGWRADCECGWKGPERKTMTEAGKDADAHRAEAGTGGDQ